MTELNTRVPPVGPGPGPGRRPAMRFSVDGWDPSYGASLELEGQLEGQLAESTARIDPDVEVPAGRWRPVDPDPSGPVPDALLFVDGVRRVEAQLWIDGDAPPGNALPGNGFPAGGFPAGGFPAGGLAGGGLAGGGLAGGGLAGGAWPGADPGGEPTAALCASYAAGVVCCCAAGAHLVVTKLRRGLFSVAPHATDIRTRAGQYQAHHVRVKRAGAPVMTTLSAALQGKLAEVEAIAAIEARGPAGDAASLPGTHPAVTHPAASLPGTHPPGTHPPGTHPPGTHPPGTHPPGTHPAASGSDLLIVDGPLRGRQHLPRVLGYIKSHHATYLPPELNALVRTLSPGQRTPAFHMGTSWDRHSWYLRLPSPPGSPWAGVVRVECPADLPVAEVTRLAALSQRCLGRFASAAYKDSRAPQNLYPIAGLERELRRRLGDPRLLYRALREAAAGPVT